MPKAGKRIGKTLPGTPLAQNMVVKSGSMSDVQCFVGYYPVQNPKWGFVTLINNWHGPRRALKDKIDNLLLDLFTK